TRCKPRQRAEPMGPGRRRCSSPHLPENQVEAVVEAPLVLAAPDRVQEGLELILQVGGGRNLAVHVVLLVFVGSWTPEAGRHYGQRLRKRKTTRYLLTPGPFRPKTQKAGVRPGERRVGMPVAEAALGERVRDGDVEAFNALYEEYAPGIYDFLRRPLRDQAAAEDLTQATFTQAFEHRSSLREPDKVRSWLWTMAHNLAMNQLGRERRSENIEDHVELAELSRGPEETAVAHDAAERVWLAAASLEPRQYAVLDLTVRRDLSTHEVAETLGVPVSHAAVLVHRSHEALGNAVRYLLVARRRERCEQLAALVPAGVRSLTPEQRSTVDHHMRRCEKCRELGDRLTKPVELFGALIFVPLSPRLAKLDLSQLLAAHAGLPAGKPPVGRALPRRRFPGGIQGLTAVVATVVVVGTGATVWRIHAASPGPNISQP